MNVSLTCVNLVKKWEGFRANAYWDATGRVWTIGYGTTRWRGGTPVKQGDTISKETAEGLLKEQIQEHAKYITTYIQAPLNQNQYDALASMCYNLGAHFLKGSTLQKHLNNKNYLAAAQSILMYNKSGGVVLAGLNNRRKDEKALFEGTYKGASDSTDNINNGSQLSFMENFQLYMKNKDNANNLNFSDEEAGGYAILKQADEMMSFQVLDTKNPLEFVVQNGKAIGTRTILIVLGILMVFGSVKSMTKEVI